MGKHIFTFEIGKDFFKNFEFSPIERGDVYVHLTFEKKENFFILDFFLDGSIEAECDRCLESFNLPINGNYKIYIKFENEASAGNEDDPDVIFISSAEIQFNVADLIYDFINLSTPIQKTCDMSVDEKKSCNPKVLDYLNNKSEEKNDDKTDPRWDLLKELNKN